MIGGGGSLRVIRDGIVAGTRRRGGLASASILALLALPGVAGAQDSPADPERGTGTVEGRVTMAATEAPLPGAWIKIDDSVHVAVTDNDGWFQIEDVPVGMHRLSVDYSNLSSVASDDFAVLVTRDQVVGVRIELDVPVFAVPELRVAVRADPLVGKMRGFDRRRTMGVGRFITRDEVTRFFWQRTSDLFRRVLGVRVVRPQGALGDPVLVSTRSFRGNCVMSVFLDGTRLAAGYPVDFVQPEDIEGIEIYSGSAWVPSEFSFGHPANCGVVAIWTRDPSRG